MVMYRYRFTDKAAKILLLAKDESKYLGYEHIGTEFLLLGLISEGTSIAAMVLRSLGVNLKDSRLAVDSALRSSAPYLQYPLPKDWEHTYRFDNVLHLSSLEVHKFNHYYIGAEHLLLAIIKEGVGGACEVLDSFDIDLKKLKTEVIKMMDKNDLAYQKQTTDK